MLWHSTNVSPGGSLSLVALQAAVVPLGQLPQQPLGGHAAGVPPAVTAGQTCVSASLVFDVHTFGERLQRAGPGGVPSRVVARLRRFIHGLTQERAARSLARFGAFGRW